MSAILPLFAALAELHLSGKSIEQVAAAFQVSAQELYHAYAARHKLWQGRFAQALSDPHLDPDLLSQYSVLASFERQYGIFMLQLHRAEENCAEAREQEPRDLKLIMKADAFALRTQQSAARMLRDLQKAEKALKKSLAPATDSPLSPPADSPPSLPADAPLSLPAKAPLILPAKAPLSLAADAPPSLPVDAPASTSPREAPANASLSLPVDAPASASQPDALARAEVRSNSTPTPPPPASKAPTGRPIPAWDEIPGTHPAQTSSSPEGALHQAA